MRAAEEEKSAKTQGRRGAAALLEKKDGFRVRFFCIFFVVKNIPPIVKNQCSLVFIGKVLLGFQTSPSTFPFLLFSSFFVNFDFFYFFLYF
jgi:hypothetical protein